MMFNDGMQIVPQVTPQGVPHRHRIIILLKLVHKPPKQSLKTDATSHTVPADMVKCEESCKAVQDEVAHSEQINNKRTQELQDDEDESCNDGASSSKQTEMLSSYMC